MRWRAAASSSNVRGYTVYGDYTRAEPAGADRRGGRGGEIDVAVVWGPLGRLLRARSSRCRSQVAPVTPHVDGPQLPMVFDISMGVRTRRRGLARRSSTRRSRAAAAGDRRHPGRRTACRASMRRRGSGGRAMRARSARSRSLPSSLAACEREERELPSRSGRRRDPARRSRWCRSRPGQAGPTEQRSGKGKELRGQRLPHRARASGCTPGSTATAATPTAAAASGPPLMDDNWIYGGAIENIVADDPRGPAERHAVVPRQDPRRPDLADRRLCALDERQRAEGRRAEPQRRHAAAARPRTARRRHARDRRHGRPRPRRRNEARDDGSRCQSSGLVVLPSPAARAGNRRSIRTDRRRATLASLFWLFIGRAAAPSGSLVDDRARCSRCARRRAAARRPAGDRSADGAAH